MDIRRLFPSCVIATGLMLAVVALPCSAVGIGEAVVQSGPGERLFVRVELTGQERIEDACLSLLAPDPLREEIGNFLVNANLSVSRGGERQFADIRSPRVLDASARLRLQVKCAGAEGVVKTLTISPPTAKSPESRMAAMPASAVTVRPHRLSAEESAALLARQDELEAQFLAMQQQQQKLQDEVAKLKSRLAQLSAAPPVAPPSPSLQLPAYLSDFLYAAIGLVLLLALWLSYRISTRLHAAPAPVSAAPPLVPAAVKHPAQAAGHGAPVAAPPRADAARAVADALSPLSLPQTKKPGVASEEDAMLEEAGLYAASGRQARAVEILQEIIRRHPSKVEAWPLLLSLYSSLGKAADFESAAREFQRRHKGSPAWSGIQALGRTLDHNNPLYADNASRTPAGASSPHRQIGDLLVEMGIMTRRDMLRYLDDFDPRKHGRFGGYLVTRKAITLAQLDLALLQQQGMGAETKPVQLPSLENIENFLADFDPKRHGSVGEFMASHDAATPEQLGKLFQPPPAAGGGAT